MSVSRYTLLWSVWEFNNEVWSPHKCVWFVKLFSVLTRIKAPVETLKTSQLIGWKWWNGKILSGLKNPHQSIFIVKLHNWADTVSGDDTVIHASRRLKVGIRSEISGVNEALLHMGHVSRCRNGLGSIQQDRLLIRLFEWQEKKADQVRGIKR